MNILNFLRKIGVLRSGKRTYKGKNVGGDYATSDVMPYKDQVKKKNKGKT